MMYPVAGQDMGGESAAFDPGKLRIGGYLDTYYGYDFNRPSDGYLPYFVSSNRHNEVNINLAYIDLSYETSRTRARLTPAFGTYMEANYAAEPGLLKNLFEASVGFRPFENRNFWIDAGVLGSPYTNESAVSRDQLMYTRSFAPEYVPYYLAGVKFSGPLNDKLVLSLYLLNGWQQIRDQNSGKSLGTQLEYRPDEKNLVNWNAYLGDERSDEQPWFRMRYFTDVFWVYNPEGRWSITSCAYIGLQQRTDSLGLSPNGSIWWQANTSIRHRFTDMISLSGRVEYFSDPESVQILPLTPADGFKSFSVGLCYNHQIGSNVMFRCEYRQFLSPGEVFPMPDGRAGNQKTWLIANLTAWF
jgi:hypothetical protein